MLILLNTGFLNAQDSVKSVKHTTISRYLFTPFLFAKKKALYKIQLQEMSGNTAEGFFTNITDDEVFYSREKTEFGSSATSVKKVNYADLDVVEVQKKDAVAISTLTGFGVGAFVSSVFGYLSYSGNSSDNPLEGLAAFDKAGKFGLYGGIAGGIIGLAIGIASKQTFTLGGKKENYKQMKFDVLEKIYGSQPATAN